MNYCPHCGAAFDRENNFCKACGTRLSQQAPAGTKKTGKKAMLTVILGLLVLAVAAQGVFMVHSRAKHQKVSQASLDELVELITANEKAIEDYFAAAPGHFGSETDGNRIIVEHIYLRQRYEDLSGRKGWKEDEYGEYRELYEAYLDLYDYFDSCSGAASFRQDRYDSLLEAWQRCQRRIP